MTMGNVEGPPRKAVFLLTGIFLSCMIVLIFAGVYFLSGLYVQSFILFGALVFLYGMMILVGKKIKEEESES